MHSKYITNNNLKRNLLVITIIINLFAIYNVSFSQGRRHLDPFQTGNYVYGDSLGGVLNDSLRAIEDSLRNLPVDSTARIKYFTFEPEYYFGTKVTDYHHPLLLGNSSHIQYNVSFDSTDKVIIRQTFLGEEIKAPLVISSEEYIKELSVINQKDIFSEIVSEKFKGVTVDELSELFEKFTDITIPLPFKSETIFGPPTINLKINGGIDITASYQNITSETEYVSTTSGTQNNINFKQEVQVTAKGTIGDKLTIDADWNTARVFDFENQLKLKYTGYADEVIQKIEAGNVSLDTKSGLIQSTQALFGIKGEFKLGPLTLSTVVSQKKSKQESKDYTGGVQETTFNIAAYEYSDNHYFLDTLYKSSFLDVFNNTSGVLSQSTYNNEVFSNDISFEVWIQADYSSGSDKRTAISYTQLYEEPPGGYPDSLIKTTKVPGLRFFGSFRKLKPTEYTIDRYAGFISLKINVSATTPHVGVTYKTQDGKKYGIGSYESNRTDTLILKLIKTENQSPDQTPLAWELKMKNIYRLPVSKVVKDGFNLDIKFEQDGVYSPKLPASTGLTKNLIELLQLDRYQPDSRNPPPDGKFDFLPGLTINTETGDVIFPTLKPFEEIPGLTDSSYTFDELYRLRKSDAQTKPLATKYRIIGSAKGEAGISNVINLGFNVVQGSVEVLLGTQKLQNNVDYTVDYGTGVVVIRNAAALASSDLRITYETNDLFSLASKTLIGLRADYKLLENTNLGFTFVNLKQETLNDKVRIGEEPTNNSMFGLDLSTEIKSKFLTKLVNFLPGYNTKEESAFTFKGEFAAITPDPNTKRSRIPQDNNESIAYVDDMEGAKKIVSLGTNYSGWTISSVPIDSSILQPIDSIATLAQSKRCDIKWFNVPNSVEVKAVYPEREVTSGQETLTPMYIQFNPSNRGVYNYNKNQFDSLSIVNKKTNWNGIMKYLNTTSTDLLYENINYIEFYMRIDSSSVDLTDGQLIIDLGSISEDAIPNGKLDTEDTLGIGILYQQNDIGLDFKTNLEELAIYNQINGTAYTNFDTIPDPGLDDNVFLQTQALNDVNGTQNNANLEGKNRPDTEDLDRNTTMDSFNEYYEYVINLDTTNNDRITGRGREGSGWYQYRIPLSEFNKKINDPSLTNIQYARVWIKGLNGAIQIALVDFNLVGNQWFKPNKNDTTYNISVVSIEENRQIYMSPVPGNVLRQNVQNVSGVETLSNEQSLSLYVSNLVKGDRKIAVKDYQLRTLDLFNYKQMKLFVNGDPSFNYVDENTYDASMVIRFGTDSNNFYEYRAPIHPDVRPGQPWNSLNEVAITFSDLTGIKITRDSINQVVDMPVPNGPPGSYYRIKGSPDLQNIREFELGVECNRGALNSSITGSVWFNEIRVLNVNDEDGFAFNLNAGIKFADLANFSFSFQKQDPNFHAIDTRVGSRYTGQSWDFSGTINIHKFINNALVSLFSDEWKDFINIPISFRHTESLTKPRYYPGTDIELNKAVEERYNKVLAETNDENIAREVSENLRIESQTLEVRNNLSFSGMALKFPGNNYLVDNILNTITSNFTASFRDYRDFTYENQSDFSYNGDISFAPEFGLADKLNLSIGKLINFGDEYKDAKLYFFLPLIPLAPLYSDNFNASTDFNRSQYESKQRLYNFDDPTGRSFTANRGFGFKWKFIENWIVDLTGSYDFRVGSNLTPLLTNKDSLNTPRAESEIFGDIFFNNGLVNFGDDLDYTQTTAFNPKFNIPVIKKYLDLNLDYSSAYGWINPNTTTNIGYNVRYSTTMNAGTNLKIKEIFSIFGGGTDVQKSNQGSASNSKNTQISDDKQSITDIFKILKSFIPDNINASVNQTNAVSNPGVEGRPGFGNFWLSPTTKDELGPSRLYQLGLSMYPGKRAPNLFITDAFSQSNNVTLTATINPIIPEAIRVNLTFKNSWGFNNTNSYTSMQDGSLGNPTNKSNNKTFGRTMFFAGDVEELRFESSTNPDVNLKNISTAFKDNIAAFPFPNWNMIISGVEKFPMFAQFATSVTIENSFSSEYNESFSVDLNNIERPTRQTVTQSFNPLFGMNITFKELLGGSLTASFRINNSISNTLVPTNNLIQTTNTNDWSVTANFAKAGFEIPFFGLSLKNDISFDLTLSKNINSPTDYIFTSDIPDKIPGNGSSVFTVNPSIQYSLSSKVQMQVFYKYIRTEPTQQTLNTVPRTSNEGGLNIRISIQ